MSWTEENEGEEGSFHFGKEALADLDALSKKMSIDSRAETIHCALKLLQWVANEREKGHILCLETADGIREVVINFLPE